MGWLPAPRRQLGAGLFIVVSGWASMRQAACPCTLHTRFAHVCNLKESLQEALFSWPVVARDDVISIARCVARVLVVLVIACDLCVRQQQQL